MAPPPSFAALFHGRQVLIAQRKVRDSLSHLSGIHPSQRLHEVVQHAKYMKGGLHYTEAELLAAMRENGITVLTVDKTIGGSEIMVSYDNYKSVKTPKRDDYIQFCAPIVFFPKRFFDQLGNVENITELDPLYAEPMWNGMIEYSITDLDSLWDTSSFVRFLEKSMGKDIYNPEEIAVKRKFLKSK